MYALLLYYSSTLEQQLMTAVVVVAEAASAVVVVVVVVVVVLVMAVEGIASRHCSEEEEWNQANFTDCSSAEFNKLTDVIAAIIKGHDAELDARQVLSTLANISQVIVANNSTRPQRIYRKDLITAVDILLNIAEYNGKYSNVSSTGDFNNFGHVASNLLDPINIATWRELANVCDVISQILVKAIDDYGLSVAATVNNESIPPQAVSTKNLLIRVDHVSTISQVLTDGLQVKFRQSSIYLPPQAFTSSQNSRIVTAIYLSLNDVLLLPKEDSSDQALYATTTIVSCTVHPRPREVLTTPVKIVVQNKMLSHIQDLNYRFGANVTLECVFWRPGDSMTWKTNGCKFVSRESNVSITTCECNHLTVFAALMDPHGSRVRNLSHKKALELISIVGCSISLFAVCVTVAVTLSFWKILESPRTKVLLNLCAAIALSCALVISEGSVINTAGCPVVAALLHYFLLALFSWMLCEGVLHYIVLVKAARQVPNGVMKFFYMFGWGFPAIVVAISLAVTQTKGYESKDLCWLDVKTGLIWAFTGPAILVITINIVVFVLVMHSMFSTRRMRNSSQMEKVKAGIKASAIILPLLGITWSFGLLSFNSDTVVFKYIFSIFNSLQGLMVFIFHCLLNRQIKDAINRRRQRRMPRAAKPVNPHNSSDNLRTNPKRGTLGQSNQAEADDKQLEVGNDYGNTTPKPRPSRIEVKSMPPPEEDTNADNSLNTHL
ncbi:adhesion G protein-coupled receptor B2-like [Montipora foliosa]|uniref:adhesion G protein-coupled receptor B2-like n=1 Tax=Montipora foliosa TaxID=591990 RepID=UPI0035F130CE